MSMDPVCGIEVPESGAAAMTLYDGVVYYFCSMTCFGRFEQNPALYVEQVA